jgi:hypothetical protein
VNLDLIACFMRVITSIRVPKMAIVLRLLANLAVPVIPTLAHGALCTVTCVAVFAVASALAGRVAEVTGTLAVASARLSSLQLDHVAIGLEAEATAPVSVGVGGNAVLVGALVRRLAWLSVDSERVTVVSSIGHGELALVRRRSADVRV